MLKELLAWLIAIVSSFFLGKETQKNKQNIKDKETLKKYQEIDNQDDDEMLSKIRKEGL